VGGGVKLFRVPIMLEVADECFVNERWCWCGDDSSYPPARSRVLEAVYGMLGGLGLSQVVASTVR
jgi:hypothetical protein